MGFGANTNAVDVLLETPLFKATRTGMVDVVQVLLLAGADPDVRDAGGCLPGDHYSSKAGLVENTLSVVFLNHVNILLSNIRTRHHSRTEVDRAMFPMSQLSCAR